MSKSKKYSEFSTFLFEISKNYLPGTKISELERIFHLEIDKYPATTSSFGNLFRLLNSLYNKYSFLKDALKYNHHIEIITAICFNSNYLTDIIIRNPEFLYQVFDDYYLRKEITAKNLKDEIGANLQNFSSFKSKVKYLRTMKRRMSLKLGLHDILGLGDLNSITFQISELATALSSELFKVCMEEISNNHNIDKPKNKYAIIALGKLGGKELNYSSDIDLMFIYDKESKTGDTKGTEYNEFISEVIQLFTQISNENSNEGFIYRVDLRLRPDGKSAPLARTLNDTVFYYETRGEPWERQMLLKAGFLGGDKKLFDDFIKRITPFVYPKSRLESPQEQIKRMRFNIEQQTGDLVDIKKSSGGIRDIEFLVQMFQMLFGGTDLKLHSGNTLYLLDYLLTRPHLKQEETILLKEAYILYRRLEHYLQLQNNTQTHTIPENDSMKIMLANYLGYKSIKDFELNLSNKRNKVREIFSYYVDQPNNVDNEDKILSSVSFTDKERAKKNLSFLRTGKGILNSKEFTSGTIKLYDEIEPILLKYLRNSNNPDRTLENFHTFIRYSSYPRIWYKVFKNDLRFEDILKLCEFSQKFIQELIIHKGLYELVLEGRIYLKNINEEFDILSIHDITFVLTCQFALGLISENDFSENLSAYIKKRIDHLSKSTLKDYDYLLCGLGSFGSDDMVYSSDIDAFLIVEEIDKNNRIQSLAQDLIDKINTTLTPFKIDFKLRPEGKNSPLVWDTDSYLKYYQQRADLWEYQAISKVKYVSGDKDIFAKLTSEVSEFYCEKDFNVRESIFKMYKIVINEKADPLNRSIDIKYSNGGLIAIQYMIEYLFLGDKTLYKKGLGTNYLQKLQMLIDDKKTGETGTILEKNFIDLKRLQLAYQNLANSDRTKISISKSDVSGFEHYLKINDKINIIDHLNKIFSSNINIMEKLLGKK